MQMFGTRLRSWMETHIVRSRKKQHRNKESTANTYKEKFLPETPVKLSDDNHSSKSYGKEVKFHDDEKLAKVSMNLQPHHQNGSCTANNLSSPESAYSTGYSTDGTSPGASVPPEYYINIRTGTHYFQSQGEVDESNRLVSENQKGRVASSNTVLLLTPRTAKRRRENAKCKPKHQQSDNLQRESSTEEDIIEKTGQTNNLITDQASSSKNQHKTEQPMNSSFHRRTESYDESQCRPELFSSQVKTQVSNTERVIEEKDSGETSSVLTNASYQCVSPYLSSASPRQRNRIRTNPWLGTQQPTQSTNVKNYNSQGESSSTVGSSSTISSSGCRSATGVAEIKANNNINNNKNNSNNTNNNCLSPKVKDKKKITKDDLKAPCNILKNTQATANASPIIRNRKLLTSVTTCSPQLNRPCRHVLHHTRSASSSSSSSSSSSRSSISNDEHHGNTSDFSDDDITLNEMLGKFDESYVYEKETDILSDSDPTDCEEQPDYNEDKVENANSSSLDGSHREELDFIDNGSLAELAYSDSECSASVNTGHCTYYHLPGYTPEMTHKFQKESLLRRHRVDSGRRHKEKDSSRNFTRKRSSSQNRQLNTERDSSNELISLNSSRRSSAKRKSSGSIRSERKSSMECLPKNAEPNIHLRQPIRPNITNDYDKKRSDIAGKHFNLNRVLMERLINNQRNGTRSADGTPISLRRNGTTSEYNGKYLRNHCVSKLLNSNVNLNERRNSFDMKINPEIENKRRSNSLTAYSSPVHRAPIDLKKPQKRINDVDKDGDLKYRRLIQEAENILEDFQVKTKPEYLSPTFRIKNEARVTPPSPLALKSQKQLEMMESLSSNNRLLSHENNTGFDSHFLNSSEQEVSNNNEVGLLKTLSKTLEKIITRNSSADVNKKLDKSVSDPFQPKKKGIFSVSALQPPIVYENKESLRRSSNVSNDYDTSTQVSNCSRPILSPGLNTKTFRVNDVRNFKMRNIIIDNNENTYENKMTCYYDGKGENIDLPLLSDDVKNLYENIGSSHSDVRRYYDQPYTVKKRNDLVSPQNRTREAVLPPNINASKLHKLSEQMPWHHRSGHVGQFREEPYVEDNFRPRSSDTFRYADNNCQRGSFTTFHSFDLGNGNVVGSRYCPQSEPVKRKVYSCSATFGKLQKSLMRKNSDHTNNQAYSDLKLSAAGAVDDERKRSSLKEKVAQLRRERLQAETRVRETKEQIERLRFCENNKIETG